MATTQAGLLQSLLMAADAAQQAYLAAQAANPDADITPLYLAEINTQTIYMTALNKTFNSDPAAEAAQQNLDALTSTINADLATITNVSASVALIGSLVQQATSVATFFT
jgi:hypothetical protein